MKKKDGQSLPTGLGKTRAETGDVGGGQ